MGIHAAVAAEFLGEELVEAVLRDYRTSPLSDSEKALLAFIQKINHHANEIDAGDVAQVKSAGWSDEAIYDTISVCALFNFYNRWVDGAGVKGLSPAGNRAAAKELAERGYIHPGVG